MLASAARADVGVQCWENEFNSAACTPMLSGRAVLKDSYLRCAHSQVELLPAQTDRIMIEQSELFNRPFVSRGDETDWKPLWPLGRKKKPIDRSSHNYAGIVLEQNRMSCPPLRTFDNVNDQLLDLWNHPAIRHLAL